MRFKYSDGNIFELNRQANTKIYIFDELPKKS
jgi:hypothetical protein